MDYEDYEDFLEELGAFLNQARTKKGLTLREVADRSGTSSANLCRLEAGKDPNPSVKRLFKICDSLDVSLSDVMLANVSTK